MRKIAVAAAIWLMAFSFANAQQKVVVRTLSQQNITVGRLSAIPDGVQSQSLNGKWSFAPAKGGKTSSVDVPGEWVMQGFAVKPGQWAEYSKEFKVSKSWNGKRIKLRFNAVYSESEIYINGHKEGYHLGGFTPFELDITDRVKMGGENLIKVLVKSESVTDSLSSASTYAVHPLGGITRDVTLFVLPAVNAAYFQVATHLDKEYKNAVLAADVVLANESAAAVKGAKLQLDLLIKRTSKVVSSKTFTINEAIAAGQSLQKSMSMDVAAPKLWDPEHPNLYQLKMTLSYNDGKSVSFFKNVGFRQVEVKGNQVFVNGDPIKLRGVCRHEVMPLRGRSLIGNQWAEDVRIFREGNVNYIRTSHYPPDAKLAQACDSLGMFLEVEAPFCWAEGTPVSADKWKDALENQTLDMVNTFRSFPSVIIWSIGNESMKYKEYFSATAKMVKDFDPTRPRNFSQYGPDGDDNELEIGNHHYPGTPGPDTYRNSKRPIVFDEYCHLNAYNRRELYTDPSLRDAWGMGFAQMWDNMYHSKGVLGGALWAGIDDTFFLPDGKTVGYGTWGPIDGWRRHKPEFWHMKKGYSPVRINLMEANSTSGEVKLAIENRFLFTDLSECRFEWRKGSSKGSFNVKAKQRESANATISISKTNSEPLVVDVYDPRGVLCDTYSFDLDTKVTELNINNAEKPIVYEESNGQLRVKCEDMELAVSSKDGAIESVKKDGKVIFSGDALLMLQRNNGEGYGTQMTGVNHVWEPLNSTCSGRLVKEVSIQKGEKEFVLTVKDEYNEAYGYTTYRLKPNVSLEVDYRYNLKVNINPRQWGLVFGLPSSFNTLKWSRQGQWNYYPEDHIGRLAGVATAHNKEELSGPAGPSKQPQCEWKDDRNELGTNDFRSTKVNIKNASISNGTSSLHVLGNGTQSVRVWTDAKDVKLLVAGYSSHGNEGFFRSHAEKFDRPLRIGDVISDSIRITF